MSIVELQFPVLGESIPSDHGYPLYSALSKRIESLHEADGNVRIGPVSGQYVGNGVLRLDLRQSWLRIRVDVEAIPMILPIAGKNLDVGEYRIRVGVPRVRALVPAASLVARTVTIKGFTDPESFLSAAQRQITSLGIDAEPTIPLIHNGPYSGKPRRRILRIKDCRVVGFSLLFESLTAEESITLQEQGLGGRGKMGCGFFVPLRKEGRK